MRLIDVDALITELNGIRYPGAPYVDAGIRIAIGKVCDAPTIEERKTGKWIPQDFNKSDGMITTAVYYYPKCSVCGWSANNTNFCPNCGADMRGEKCPVNFVKP